MGQSREQVHIHCGTAPVPFAMTIHPVAMTIHPGIHGFERWIRALAALSVADGPGGASGGGARDSGSWRSSQTPTPSLVHAVRTGLTRLPERQRRAIELRHLVGLEVGEVATALGHRECVVRWRLARGLAALRRECARHGLAADGTILVLALSALAPPSPSADSVARCAAIAASGPLAAAPRRLAVARLLAALSGDLGRRRGPGDPP